MKLKRLLMMLFVIAAMFVSGSLLAQQVTVKGRITDSKTSLPLAGATIKVKNGTVTTVTDVNGMFTINAPSSETVLTISYVGYKLYEAKAGTGVLTIELENTGVDLNEVVVVGYGAQKRAHLTGSVATVDMQKITDLPVSSLAEGLKGQIPGLNVSGGSQRPGDNSTLSIRQNFGFSKDGSSSLPLIVIDDIIQVDPNTGLPTMDQFNALDPSEVESITVLRDASAAIYGARASQGLL
ncbi:MAG: TonB-dependent receptor plug domain-containing protein [Chitinophagaceae bacterium]|nr:TonB-dependent receptor plug domain-containing protein [Chitinophagaceae bacterium]